jgi:hypothetical protein
MATPHVAGAWAVLKQGKPSADAAEILEALTCTGRPVGRAGVTKPRIDVLKALDVLRFPRRGLQLSGHDLEAVLPVRHRAALGEARGDSGPVGAAPRR